MAKKTDLESLFRDSPAGVLFGLDTFRKMTEESAAELSVAVETLDQTIKRINTVEDFETHVKELREQGEAAVADVLAYPLPILSDRRLLQDDGRPNWKLMKELWKAQSYRVRLPLTPATLVTFEVAHSFMSVILDPAYGRRQDLEQMATFSDAAARRPLRSFSIALLTLRRLTWTKGLRQCT